MNIPTYTLKRALESVIQAAADDGYRPMLTVIHWNCAGDQAILTAADGYMLTQRRVVASETDNPPMAGLLPKSAMQAVVTLCETTSAIQITVVDGAWRFETMDTCIVAKPLAWSPPDYRKVFDKFHTETALTITVDRNLLLAALDQAGPRITLRLSATDQPLLLSSPDHRSMVMPMSGTATGFDYLEPRQ